MESVHEPQRGLLPRPRSVCLLTKAQGGETTPGPRGVQCWVAQISRWHFLLWTDVRLLLLREGRNETCLIQSCCWHNLSVHLQIQSKQLLISNSESVDEAWNLNELVEIHQCDSFKREWEAV